MKYLKKFEKIENKPQVGDYVIMNTGDDEIRNFLSTNIGEITAIDNMTTIITVRYMNVPKKYTLSYNFYKNMKQKFIQDEWLRDFSIKLIAHHSKNIKDLEEIIIVNNL